MREIVNIEVQRRLVVQEALSWQFTPFHWHQQVKGGHGGCDCGSLLKASYDRVGANVELPRPDGKPYTTQFFLHGTEEVYLNALANYCYVGHQFKSQGWRKRPCPKHQERFDIDCIACNNMTSELFNPGECATCGLNAESHLLAYPEIPLPGDIVVFWMGKAYGHAGVIVDWPQIVHSHARDGYVTKSHVEMHPELNFRKRLYFSLKQWHPERI